MSDPFCHDLNGVMTGGTVAASSFNPLHKLLRSIPRKKQLLSLKSLIVAVLESLADSSFFI